MGRLILIRGCGLFVHRYGSIPGYLSAAGFTVDEQQALKDIFLETC